MKKIFFFILMVIGAFQINAQTPKYYYSLVVSKGLGFYGSFGVLNYSSSKYAYQFIYYPADLNNPPKGLITHIYLHQSPDGYTGLSLPSKIPKFKVRMGLTTSDSFGRTVDMPFSIDNCQPKNEEGLFQTVIYDTLYTIPDTTFGTNPWLRLPLQNPFYYTPNKKLIVEFSCDSNSRQWTVDSTSISRYYNGPHIYVSGYDRYRTDFDSVNLGVAIDSFHINQRVVCTGTNRFDLGFDLDTTVNSIDDIPKQPLRVYPNPASSHITLTYSGSNTAYQISNITGQVVQTGTVSNHTIDIRHLPRGMYLLRMGYEVVRFFKEEE
ncbi:MAG: T9SS type A sorting domain-containing protein [Bacteroidia bacterium]|nr:MAG: T9SS type A sorting domain-containing protein [Bacteroidia bacterium]